MPLRPAVCISARLLVCVFAIRADAAEPTTVSFQRDVAPILERRCLECHGNDEPKGNLSLASSVAAMKGGDSGPSIVPGKPDESSLLDYVTVGSDGKAEMPKGREPLSAEQVDTLRLWIASGATWPDGVTLRDKRFEGYHWWSLEPLIRSVIPHVADAPPGTIRHPIDAFIVAKLREKKLTPSPQADPVTLCRRLYFDLIGLPPTPEEMEEFISQFSSSRYPTTSSLDRRNDEVMRMRVNERAYEALVDKLLASPHYGERWARHWLDVVHFGETHGYDKDKPRPNAWPYRDYVIRSFNDDKPYGRFVGEQIAGDVLYPATRDGIEALGFISAGPWDYIGHAEVPETKIDGKVARHLDRDDMIVNTIQTFNSLTVQCAQCHDHKFDPITQADYYSLQAVFAAIDRADKKYDVDPAIARRRTELQARLDAIASAGDADESNEFESLKIAGELAKLPPQATAYIGAVHSGKGNFRGTGNERGKPRPIFVLARGNVTRPGKEVGPGSLSCLTALSSRFELSADAPESERRAALARWITNEKNPLTWRSIVNRVWQYHFGRGLVDTPNDFGRNGATPTHPELLDWLAADFRDHGSSLKRLHRMIVTSATYQQASAGSFHNASIDADNRYLWRMNRRRLDAESIRDSLLATSGMLDRTMYGPSFQDFAIEKPEHSPHYEYHLHDPEDPKSHRRTIYRFIVRSQPQPFLMTFDCADPSMQVDKRNESISPLQALTLLNDGVTIVAAKRFAAKLEGRHGSTADRIERAFYDTTGRRPSDDERSALVACADKYGLPAACRVLFNLNEFMFVD